MDFDPSEVARLRAGDVGALERCYRVFGARVRRLCRSLVGRDGADDAAQEVFVKVFERACQFSGEARFSTWIYRVTVNHCLHQIERERRRSAEPLPEDARSGCDGVRAVDERESVEHLLGGLSEDQRAVLLLREVEGLDYREIAAVLELPLGTVMSRLNRARQRWIEIVRAARGPLAIRRMAP